MKQMDKFCRDLSVLSDTLIGRLCLARWGLQPFMHGNQIRLAICNSLLLLMKVLKPPCLSVTTPHNSSQSRWCGSSVQSWKSIVLFHFLRIFFFFYQFRILICICSFSVFLLYPFCDRWIYFLRLLVIHVFPGQGHGVIFYLCDSHFERIHLGYARNREAAVTIPKWKKEELQVVEMYVTMSRAKHMMRSLCYINAARGSLFKFSM